MAFGREEHVQIHTGEQLMQAAMRVACVLAMYDLPGFRNLLQYLEVNQQKSLRNWRRKREFAPWYLWPTLIFRVRDAFTIIADTDIIPTTAKDGHGPQKWLTGKDGYGPQKYSDDWPPMCPPGFPPLSCFAPWFPPLVSPAISSPPWVPLSWVLP